MSDFVKVIIPSWLRGESFKARILEWRDDALAEAGKIVDRESKLSVRQRFYRSGTAQRSLRHEIVSEHDSLNKSYEQFSELFYFRFGEYGTGQRGEASDVPHPADYIYGQKPGMSARFMLGHALRIAEPEVVSEFKTFARELPARITA